MGSLDHPSVQKVRSALIEAGAIAAADGIRLLDEDARTAAAAATALGVEVAAIANSLVFRAVSADGAEWPLLVLASGAHRADTHVLAALVGAERVDRADPDFVRVHTGQPIGGVAPVGHPSRIRTLVDTTLAGHPVVWAAAGHPKAVFPTTFAELVELSGGEPAEVTS
ncbi:YbaK/EbsC family protein [Gandjariella thermophila]|uniref:Aminoacyl-tRNA deacylase n=1 Tax=Gandjariella thermophila TaxID=1931992 RepID=A0A4D4J764_9PSEU|nr:YbaK/EbsC family protein [Gandjariella thermophila]GDY30356.1 aminoacyl-tRNA deacylase [Gandjariella thermophila]